jgi:hypothetical protein
MPLLPAKASAADVLRNRRFARDPLLDDGGHDGRLAGVSWMVSETAGIRLWFRVEVIGRSEKTGGKS